MASIRRTLSPVPRAGTAMNGEACLAASPLSRSSNCSPPSDSQDLFFGVFSPKNPKPAEKPKHNNKPQPWKRPVVQFSACFVLGIFLGFTPFLSSCLAPKHQAFSFETVPESERVLEEGSFESLAGIYENDTRKLEPRKLLIVVTLTQPGLTQSYRLNRLSHTLRLVAAPMLWIVVEMTSQSSETAGVLRRTGVMYRHLVCSDVNVTGDTSARQRNVALKHIETHRLDGIVYFADDENVYSTELFDQLRQIRRFGIWKVAKMAGDDDEQKGILDGPVCNGSEVIGWHVNEPYRRYQRFYAEMSGFAFNSTLLWDTEKWHRPMLEPIRHRDKLKDNALQVSSFIEQIVEDESQMEGLMEDCSRIMVWHARLGSTDSIYPRDWVLKENLDALTSLSS